MRILLVVVELDSPLYSISLASLCSLVIIEVNRWGSSFTFVMKRWGAFAFAGASSEPFFDPAGILSGLGVVIMPAVSLSAETISAIDPILSFFGLVVVGLKMVLTVVLTVVSVEVEGVTGVLTVRFVGSIV